MCVLPTEDSRIIATQRGTDQHEIAIIAGFNKRFQKWNRLDWLMGNIRRQHPNVRKHLA